MLVDREEELIASKIFDIAREPTASNRPLSPEEVSTPLEMFGITIGTIRRRRAITIKELAERSNIGLDSLLRIELGSTPFETVTKALPGIAKALEIDPQLLFILLYELVLNE
jgi:hypothetical protein